MIRGELKPTLRLAGPVVLAELGWMGMGVVDTIMVGPLGPAAIGAAGVGNSMHLGFAIFGMGLLLGLDTLVSQAYGAGDLALCRAWLGRGVQLALLDTVPLMLVLAAVWFAVPALGFHPDTLPLLRGYFAIVVLSTPFLLLYAAFRRYLQSTHHVAPIMFALVSANLINAVANWVLIYGTLGMPALGRGRRGLGDLRGTGLHVRPAGGGSCGGRGATGTAEPRRTWQQPVARRPSGGWSSWVSRRRPPSPPRSASSRSPRRLPGRLEPVATASHQIALNIAAVAFMIPLGLASAGAVRVGNAVGARNPRGAAAAGWTVIAMGVAFMLVLGCAVRRRAAAR